MAERKKAEELKRKEELLQAQVTINSKKICFLCLKINF